MFKELVPILRKGDTLVITIGHESDGPTGAVFRVNVMPKLFTLDGDTGADRKALNTPISLSGTAEELDSPAFIETLNRFTSSAQTCRNTIDEVEATHKAAAEAAKSKPAPAKSGHKFHKSYSKPAETKPAKPETKNPETETPAAPAEPEATPLGI
jgi:PRTRC genetic system protein E